MLRALLKCQASKFDQPDEGDRHNVIKNTSIITHQQMHQYYLLFKIGFKTD
jgi:hypothetical protein